MDKKIFYKKQKEFWKGEGRLSSNGNYKEHDGVRLSIFFDIDSRYNNLFNEIELKAKVKDNAVKILLLGYTNGIIKRLKETNNIKIHIIDFVEDYKKFCDEKIEFQHGDWVKIEEYYQEKDYFDFIIGDVVFSNLYYDDWDNVLSQLSNILKDEGIYYFRELFVPKERISVNDILRNNDPIEKKYLALRFSSEIVKNTIDEYNILEGFKVFKKLLSQSNIKNDDKIYSFIKNRKNKVVHSLQQQGIIDMLVAQYFKPIDTGVEKSGVFYSSFLRKTNDNLSKVLKNGHLKVNEFLQKKILQIDGEVEELLSNIDNEIELFKKINDFYEELSTSFFKDILDIELEDLFYRFGISLFNAYKQTRFSAEVKNNGKGLITLLKDGEEYKEFLKNYRGNTLSKLVFEQKIKKIENHPLQFFVYDNQYVFFNINNINDYILYNKDKDKIEYSSDNFERVLKEEKFDENKFDALKVFIRTNLNSPFKVYSLSNTLVESGGVYYLLKRSYKDIEITYKHVKLLNSLISIYNDYFFNIISGILSNARLESEKLVASISKIINRNYAHHIGSHVSHRSTIDKIIERIEENNIDFNENSFISLIEMENKLTYYKDERNDFISAIDTNSHPVTMRFYQDIILPFQENSLLMDNLAKSEGVQWGDGNKMIYGKDGASSKLRIRVFYHDKINIEHNKGNIIEKKETNCDIPIHPDNVSFKNVHCSFPGCKKENGQNYLEKNDLELNGYHEICAFYSGVNSINPDDRICVHKLPYYRKLDSDKKHWYINRKPNCNDIEISVPGTLGAHAIYSMLENHIRNVAKHADREILENVENVDIIIKVSLFDDDYYKIELTTNIPTFEEVFNEFEAKKNKDKAFAKLFNASKRNIGDTFLGVSDLKINSNLLAFNEITNENLNNAINVAHLPKKKGLKNEERPSYAINYVFKLTKPKKVVFIGDFKKDVDEDKTKGIYCFNNYEEYNDSLHINIFEFAVISETAWKQTKKKDLFLKKLPFRILCLYSHEFYPGSYNRKIYAVNRNVLFNSGNKFDIDIDLSKLWQVWLTRWKIKDEKSAIHLFLDQNKNEEPTKSFIIESEKSIHKNKLVVWFKEGTKRIVSNDNYLNKSSHHIFDRHGDFAFNEIVDNLKLDKPKKYFKNQLNTIEIIEKANPDFDILFTSSLNKSRELLYKMVESQITKILILDERVLPKLSEENELVKRKLTGNNSLDNNFYSFAKLHNVIMCDRVKVDDNVILKSEEEVARAILNFNTTKQKIYIEYEDTLINAQNKKITLESYKSFLLEEFDIIIIHRTILDNLVKELDKNPLLIKFVNSVPWFVVDTGGGVINYSTEIQNSIRKKISFTIVQKLFFGEAIAKLVFNKVL